jgi:arginine:ornithine antiporter / lysine permease
MRAAQVSVAVSNSYPPGTWLFSCCLARRERKEAVFKPVEAALFATLANTACAGIYTLEVGAISI